jgi:hypothetical protein
MAEDATMDEQELDSARRRPDLCVGREAADA